jgi:peptide deformylase
MNVTTVGDPVLRTRAAEVSLDELREPSTQRLIDEMVALRRSLGGAGLAANQVSVLKRIAVVEVDDATRYAYKPFVPLTVLVNPMIEPLSEERLPIVEGCLSVPDLRGEVSRALRVAVEFLDRHGVRRRLLAEGLTAGTFQHEIDHLDGVLFVDRVADPRTFATWEQFERRHQAAWLERVAPWVRK